MTASELPPVHRTPTDVEASEFRAIGLTPGHWAALAPAPLFRSDLRTPERSEFRNLHPLRLFLRTVPDLAAEAEGFWARVGARELKGEGLEIAYALLGWHLANDLARPRREEFLQLLHSTAQTRRAKTERSVPVERDVRRWVDAYIPVAKYTRHPSLMRPDPPDPADVGKLLGRDLWKQMLTAPLAAALRESNAAPGAAHRVAERLAAVSEPDPLIAPHPLESHLAPGWLRLFGSLLTPDRAVFAPPQEDAMRIVARGLASTEFDERETILAALRKELELMKQAPEGEAFAATWIDRLRESIEEVLRSCRTGSALASLPRTSSKTAPVDVPPPPSVKARTWLCGHCGIENAASAGRCVGCGLPALPPLVLRSIATGREEEVRTTRRLGRQVFAHRLRDPDAKFASELQFEVVRDETAAGWVVRPLPDAVNPTFYDGTRIDPDGILLADGGVISIGKSKLKLQVRLTP